MIDPREIVKLKIMEVMQAHRGHEKAIVRKDLLLKLNHALRTACRPELVMDQDNTGDCREFRRLYIQLPLAVGDAGLFVPIRPAEVVECRAYLLSKIPASQADLRVRRIYSTWPELCPTSAEVQMEMFGG